jgi:disulfide oxidoreductase YuzD
MEKSSGGKMKVKIVLNGGLRSCCSSYPPEFVREIVKSWLSETDIIEGIDIIDKKEENYLPDELASLAEKYFGEAIYPLVYIGETLVAIGDIPNNDTLSKMATEQEKFCITEKDILDAAERQGLLKKE